MLRLHAANSARFTRVAHAISNWLRYDECMDGVFGNVNKLGVLGLVAIAFTVVFAVNTSSLAGGEPGYAVTPDPAFRKQVANLEVEQLEMLLDMLTTDVGTPRITTPEERERTLEKLTTIASLYQPEARVPDANVQVQLRARNALAQHVAANHPQQLEAQLVEMRRLSDTMRRTKKPQAQARADYWDLVADMIQINAQTQSPVETRQDAARQRLDRFVAEYPLVAKQSAAYGADDTREEPDKHASNSSKQQDGDTRQADVGLQQKLAIESRFARLRLDLQRGLDASSCEIYRALAKVLSPDDPRMQQLTWMPTVCQWLAEPTKAEAIDIAKLPFDRVALKISDAGIIEAVIPNPPLPVEDTPTESQE